MKKIILLTGILFATASCSQPDDRGPIKGISSLVDTIKSIFGFGKQESSGTAVQVPQAASIHPAPSTVVPPQLEAQTTQATQVPSPSINTSENSSPPAPPQRVEPDIQHTAPLDDRIKAYRLFEEKAFSVENQKIQVIQDETNKQLDDLMKDPRVADLIKSSPQAKLNEFPQDIYQKTQALIEAEDKQTQEVMDATDKILLNEAMRLQVHEQIAQEELNRDHQRHKRLENLHKDSSAPIH